MTLHLAVRSLLVRPVRSAVLACGFGFGIAVMATLLGVGEVILDQARSPALKGGGDVVLHGSLGTIGSARYMRSRVLASPSLAPRVRAISPSHSSTLYMVRGGETVPLRVQGGIPSLERALGDPETAGVLEWVDAPEDRAWTSPDPGDLLRAMDRFHPIPAAPDWEGSWAEWLYFNGRSDASQARTREGTSDGSERFYVTFLVGPRTSPGRRIAGVRLQLERGGIMTSHSASSEVSEDEILSDAPDLTIGSCRVRLEGMTYRIDLDLPSNESSSEPPEAGPGRAARPRDTAPAVLGTLRVRGAEGASFPPFAFRGARGWISGYTVPVLSGRVDADLRVGGRPFRIENGAAYHDHNWGFWEGVTWQWGQVAHEGLSFVYGRLHPPADAADPDRVPGFLGVIGPQGPLGYSSSVTIVEEAQFVGSGARREPTSAASSSGVPRTSLNGASSERPRSGEDPRADAHVQSSAATDAPPQTIKISARGPEIDLTLTATIVSAVPTRMGGVFASSARLDPSTNLPLRSGEPDAEVGEQRDEEVDSQRSSPHTTFWQMRARFHVTGRAAGRSIDFTSLGSAETFRADAQRHTSTSEGGDTARQSQ